jgi:hypothetical protein
MENLIALKDISDPVYGLRRAPEHKNMGQVLLILKKVSFIFFRFVSKLETSSWCGGYEKCIQFE